MTSMPTVNRDNDPFEFEKRMRRGKKFVPKETKGEKFRKDISKEIKEIELRKQKDKPRKLKRPDVSGPQRMKDNMMDFKSIPELAKGGRVGLKAGSKGCKLAKRGRGRAYGKNS
jgi:hypothetical protein